ncbi:hypothetical protein EDC04DRAFT_3089064 [Pisolithus marmoratus]|nr:hypothetical protein EDC04DRAFT_3089064 [Pisolithus marmoratus]
MACCRSNQKDRSGNIKHQMLVIPSHNNLNNMCMVRSCLLDTKDDTNSFINHVIIICLTTIYLSTTIYRLL